MAEVRLRMSNYMARALDYLSHRTGMDNTNIVRQAVMEYIQRRFTKYDHGTVESVENGALIDALDEWVHWNMFLKEIPKDQANLWKELAIKSLQFTKSKGQLPMVRDLYKLGDWNKLDRRYESWLQSFLIYQDKITTYDYKEIPLPEKDKYKKLLDQGKKVEYYNKKWEEYAEKIIDELGDMAHPLYSILYTIKREKSLVTDRETALYILAQLLKNKGLKVEEKKSVRGPAGFSMDSGEVAKLLATGKINENETLDQAVQRLAFEEWEKQIKEVTGETRAERVLKNLDEKSYNGSKRMVKQFNAEKEGKDPFAKEKEYAKKMIEDPNFGITKEQEKEIDKDRLMDEFIKLDQEREKNKEKNKKNGKKKNK